MLYIDLEPQGMALHSNGVTSVLLVNGAGLLSAMMICDYLVAFSFVTVFRAGIGGLGCTTGMFG